MPNVAVLIDAENVLPIFADQIFTHAASLGEVAHKEIYGAAAALNAWVEPVLKYAMHPNLTIRPSKYKNTSDIALVIGAMDLLAGQNGGTDVVIIASSDSDFSALSVRLRTGGVEVVGMGTDKSNELWRTACSSFVLLQTPARPAPQQSRKPEPQPRKTEPQRPAPEKAAEKAPEKAVKVTPTHSGRIANIRAFILNQLSAREGRMPSHALFSLLNDLPDYRYDQQRSKRKPLDYLARQMGGALKIEEAPEGGTWVTAAAPEKTPEAAQDVPAPEQEEAQAVQDAAAETEAGSEPGPMPDAETPAPSQEPDPIALLTGAGVPEDAARQIAAICNDSADRRAVYNKLRKAFGTADARKYLQILKEAAGEA